MLLRILILAISIFTLTVPLAAQKKAASYWVERANKTQDNSLKISYYSEAIKLDPANAQNYLWRGFFKRAIGKYRESLVDFDSAITRQPVYELAFSIRGESYLQIKAYKEAINDFKRTLSINPASDFALSRWAEVDRLQMRPREALARFAQANRLNPRNDFALVRRAALHLEAGTLDSAIQFATNTLEINPLNEWAWQIRGNAYQRKGEFEKAEADLRMSVAKNPLNTQAQILLAEVLKKWKVNAVQQEKNWREAMNILYNILEKEPNRKDIRQALTELERLTEYRPLRLKPRVPVYRTGIEVVAKVPPPMEARPRTAPLTVGTGLPKSVDYSADICSPREQGVQSSCGSFALTYLACFHEKKETGKMVPFSAAFLYHQLNGGQDKGVNLEKALDLWQSKGVCLEYTMRYQENDYLSPPSQEAFKEAKKYKIQGSFPLWTLEELKYQLSIGNPLIISVLADKSLLDLHAEPWTKRYGKAEGAHAMLIVGYDDDKGAIKVINSWGRGWGDGGYGWISYTLFDEVRLQLFVTKDAVNAEDENYADIVMPEPGPHAGPQPSPGPFPHFRFGTPYVAITRGFRNSHTGTLDIVGTSNVPPLAGFFAQIVVYYYDAQGYQLRSQQFPYMTFDGQASHATDIADVSFLGLPNETWWIKTPSTVFPLWEQSGAVILAQPVLFIDGFQAAVGPFFQM